MADFLALDLNKFENQIFDFIEIYYNLLKKEKDKSLTSIKENGGIEWREQIVNLLEEYYKDDNQKWLNLLFLKIIFYIIFIHLQNSLYIIY
jgi:hypothetical protein